MLKIITFIQSNSKKKSMFAWMTLVKTFPMQKHLWHRNAGCLLTAQQRNSEGLRTCNTMVQGVTIRSHWHPPACGWWTSDAVPDRTHFSPIECCSEETQRVKKRSWKATFLSSLVKGKSPNHWTWQLNLPLLRTTCITSISWQSSVKVQEGQGSPWCWLYSW